MSSALRAWRIGRVLLRFRLDEFLHDTPAAPWLRLARPFVPRASSKVAAMPRGVRLRLALQELLRHLEEGLCRDVGVDDPTVGRDQQHGQHECRQGGPFFAAGTLGDGEHSAPPEKLRGCIYCTGWTV